MLGGVRKQLVVALAPKFGRFHAARIVRLNKPKAGVAPNALGESMSAEQTKDVLNDQVGLDAQYLQAYRWPSYREDVVPEELSLDPLYQLWAETSGGHKWTQYFLVIADVFGPLTSRPMRILEIGVLNGAGLRLWRRYFSHADTVVVGIDILPGCARFESPNEGIHACGSEVKPIQSFFPLTH